MVPKISVLIPVYNAERFLPKCLQSLSAQSFSDYEIVCVDDGSTDGTLSCLKAFALQEPRLQVLHQRNQGVAVTRNRLLETACGKYVCFVDADDWVSPDFLQKLYETAEETGAQLTRCFFKEYNQTTRTWQEPFCSQAFFKRVGHQVLARLRAGYYDSVVWGKLYLLEWIRKEKIRFLTGQVAEDNAFSALAFVLAPRVATVTMSLYFYRREVSQSITSCAEKMYAGALHNRLYLCDELARRGMFTPCVVDQLLCYVIGDLCRFRKLPREKQKKYELLFGRALAYLRRDKAFCSWYGRLRVRSFLLMAGTAQTRRFYFWGKVFR